MISKDDILQYFDEATAMEQEQTEEYEELLAGVNDESLKGRFEHLLKQEREHVTTVAELRQRILEQMHDT